MFDKKKLKEARKEILKKEDIHFDSDDNALITVKAESEEQIFSSYDYDNNEKLNEELADYIWDKARFVPSKNDIRIKVYTSEKVDAVEVETAIHNKYKKEYLELREEKKRNALFSLAMLIAGLFVLGILYLSYLFFKNEFLDVILEIVTWVFIWEAADAFFLQRASLRRRQFTLLKLCTANVEVVKKRTQKKKETVSYGANK